MTEQAGGAIEGTGRALKRRGILAAAGTAVAAVMAKQTVQSVAAAGSLVLETTNTVIAGTTTIKVGAGFVNTVFEVDATASTANVLYIDAIRGHGQFTGAGVHGFGADASTNTGAGLGVQGTGGNGGGTNVRDGGRGVYAYGGTGGIGGDGVYAHGGGAGTAGLRGGYGVYAEAGSGEATSAIYAINRFQSTAGHVGVTGICTSTGGIGVEGQCDVATGIGVVGASVNGVGVKGAATSGFPVIGQVTGPTSLNAGLLGVGTAGPGVQGQSTGGHGLVGTTSATDGVHIGLVGYVQPGSNAIAVRGTVASGAVGYAGIFDGDVLVNGALRVFGSPKNAAVKHPGDGTYRLLYCVESPESWFEDVGKANLVNGDAAVKLDPDFAVLIHTDDYHIFLTPYGSSQGLYVAKQTATGFTVREQGGGKSNLTFSWKVQAKRKDIVGERLAKVDPPVAATPPTRFTVPSLPAKP